MRSFSHFSQFVKCGFAGSNFPTSIFPSLVGRPMLRSEEKVNGVQLRDIMVGQEASDQRAQLQLSYPMENGVIRNWEDMHHLWNHTFDEVLKVDASKRPSTRILLTEPPLNPENNRKKMVSTMLEEYNFHSVYVAVQAVLTLYAQGACFSHNLLAFC